MTPATKPTANGAPIPQPKRKLEVSKAMSRKPGFRATISRGWYVWEGGKPILGPYRNKGEASKARDAELMKESSMAEKKSEDRGETRETEKTSERTTETRSGAREEKRDPSEGGGSKESKAEDE